MTHPTDLVIELLPVFDTGLAYRVVSQPDDIVRGCGDVFGHANGWAILSQSSPEIIAHAMTIFIRGANHKADKYGTMARFFSPSARDAAIREITKCVEAFNKSRRPKRKVPVEMWANIYRQGASAYNTKASADNFAGCTRIACVRLTGEYEVAE